MSYTSAQEKPEVVPSLISHNIRCLNIQVALGHNCLSLMPNLTCLYSAMGSFLLKQPFAGDSRSLKSVTIVINTC